MTLRIRTNMASMVAQRHLGSAETNAQAHMEKLSSGQRVNKSADDAAGLAVGEVLRSDIRSLTQARRNTNDGVSLIQVAEGGLNEISNIMIRLKELAVQSSSDTISDRERQYLNLEYFQLKDEVDRIALSTEFNGSRLLTGDTELPPSLATANQMPPFEIQVDKDYSPDIDGKEIRNPVDIIKLDFGNINAMTSGEKSLGIGTVDDPEGTRVDTKEGAHVSMVVLDQGAEKIFAYRAQLGALQNRLESTDRNLGIRLENLSSARSRIMDADFANETAEFTQWTILQKAGASVLAQANQMPSLVLQLLQ